MVDPREIGCGDLPTGVLLDLPLANLVWTKFTIKPTKGETNGKLEVQQSNDHIQIFGPCSGLHVGAGVHLIQNSSRFSSCLISRMPFPFTLVITPCVLL